MQFIPALAAYEAQRQAALQADPPILLLDDAELSEEGRLAQSTALQHPQFVELTRDPDTGQPLRNEIMSLRPALPSDLTDSTARRCGQNSCYRVELYHYAYNAATVAIVDVDTPTVVAVNTSRRTQPELNKRLTELATQLAINAPEVKTALRDLGVTVEETSAVMPNIKTALNGSRCERSLHLCVAPTFLVGDQAVWAIVDLTARQLVGVRLTDLGDSGPPPIVTERTLQNEYVMTNFCNRSNSLNRADWELDYLITGSDGLMISNVRFQGQPVLQQAKLVDWHVSYSWKEGFGYSDAVGCPMFSSASVVAFNGPHVEDLIENGEPVGFALMQDFRSPVWPLPCNYRYENRYEFYHDGRFRIIAANYGRGCGNQGVYRPVLRIDLAGGSDNSSETLAEWQGQTWQSWHTEQWQLQSEDTAYTTEGYQYRFSRTDGSGYYILPGQGQFDHNREGDQAYLYVTVKDANRDEGESDLITIGPCCNTDHQQGPEKFMEPPESLTNQELVLWYVPQLPNDDTPGAEYCWADSTLTEGIPTAVAWPCYAGPMFVPFTE